MSPIFASEITGGTSGFFRDNRPPCEWVPRRAWRHGVFVNLDDRSFHGRASRDERVTSCIFWIKISNFGGSGKGCSSEYGCLFYGRVLNRRSSL